MKHGKKYTDSLKAYDRSNLFEAAEALETAVKTAKAKFDETVEVHIRLGVDSRHADQQVRGAVVLLTEPVKQFGCWLSAKATMWKLPRLPALTMSAKNMFRRFSPKAGWISMWLSLLRYDGRCWPSR